MANELVNPDGQSLPTFTGGLTDYLAQIAPDLTALYENRKAQALAYLLTGDAPAEAIDWRTIAKGQKVPTIHSWWFRDQLNALFVWSQHVVSLSVNESDEVEALVRLTIDLPDGRKIEIERTGGRQIGRYSEDTYEMTGKNQYALDANNQRIVKHHKGDLLSLRNVKESAISLGLTACCRALGFGRNVYDLEEPDKRSRYSRANGGTK